MHQIVYVNDFSLFRDPISKTPYIRQAEVWTGFDRLFDRFGVNNTCFGHGGDLSFICQFYQHFVLFCLFVDFMLCR